jgi:hypothetical protein
MKAFSSSSSTALLACAFLVAPVFTLAQSQPRISGPEVTTAKKVEDKNRELLDSDPRLKVKVTLSKRSVTLNEALRSLTNISRVSFLAEDNEAANKRLSFAFENTPLKDVLEGIAALYYFEVELRKSGILVFRAGKAGDQFDPDTASKEDLSRAGNEFADSLDKLSTEKKDALDRGLPMSELPPAMQAAARGMISARIAELEGSPREEDKPFVQLGRNLLGKFGLTNAQWHSNGSQCTLSLGMPNAGQLGITFRRSRP